MTSVHVLVSDTSVLIDLERGGLLESAFSCRLTLVVPEFLYERELVARNGSVVQASLYDGLMRISCDPRCRLPRAEVAARLKYWGQT